MFVRISTDTISSLTMHFIILKINSLNKQDSCGGKTRCALVERIPLFSLFHYSKFHYLSLIIVENVDPAAYEVSLGSNKKIHMTVRF